MYAFNQDVLGLAPATTVDGKDPNHAHPSQIGRVVAVLVRDEPTKTVPSSVAHLKCTFMTIKESFLFDRLLP